MSGFRGSRSNLLVGALDALTWPPALLAAVWLRFELSFPTHWVDGLLAVAAMGAGLQLVVGILTGLYRRWWPYGSLEELGACTATTLIVAALVTFTNWGIMGRALPVSTTIVAAPMALIMMVGARYLARLLWARRARPGKDPATTAEHVVVFGAGSGGSQVLTAMLTNPSSPFMPVALLDDDPKLRYMRIKGVQVRGGLADLADVVAATNATAVIVAIPSASGALIRQVATAARAAGIKPLVLPPVADLFGKIGLSDIRQVTAKDLLGRHEIKIDLAAVANLITGKTVLVTGAGGSIGSELCRQIQTYAPGQLVMVDHDDTALHGLQLSMTGKALLDDPNLVLADVRDAPRMFSIFRTYRPDVVFHAAALKHLSILESCPDEGYKTNVIGTYVSLMAARAVGVKTFVNVSTDKAADPTSILGSTKRQAERLTATLATEGRGTYLSVRFGNVLGSRGSVLPTMRAQIAAGGPVTVTDPDVTRYFMTVEEAVRLVLCAAAFGGNGETLVLDMGAPVRIADVARQLIAESDRPIEIVYTGLRPGEKLHEVLLDEGTPDVRPHHPLVTHTRVEPVSDEIRADVERSAGIITDLDLLRPA